MIYLIMPTKFEKLLILRIFFEGFLELTSKLKIYVTKWHLE
jgi:hypothetical protein